MTLIKQPKALEFAKDFLVTTVSQRLDPYLPLIGTDGYSEINKIGKEFRNAFGTSTMWHINSTPAGGGVAEMLPSLVGLTMGVGIDVRWGLIHGEKPFFDLTKRIHNQIHGKSDDDITFSQQDRETYDYYTSKKEVQRLRSGLIDDFCKDKIKKELNNKHDIEIFKSDTHVFLISNSDNIAMKFHPKNDFPKIINIFKLLLKN